MTDLQAKLERFETLAAECNLIGGYLATDPRKRELYLRLAKNYRQLADDIRGSMPPSARHNGEGHLVTLPPRDPLCRPRARRP